MTQVVATFSGYSLADRQREKRFLRRLDALAREVIGDVEHPVPVEERIGAWVEVVRQALNMEGAALLLADREVQWLLPVTATGCWSGGADLEPVACGSDSFVARVAASEEPVELADATRPPFAVGEGVRQSGVRSLLGLRLWPHGKLLGVFYVGSLQARPFEPQAQRYLETLVEYLSGIIEKALLLRQLRESNERLRHSESLHRLASEAISDAIWDWSLGTDTLFWIGTEKLLGFTPEQLGPSISGWTDNIHPEDRERVLHGIHVAIDGPGERWHDEYRFRQARGGYVDVTDHGLIERDARGRGGAHGGGDAGHLRAQGAGGRGPLPRGVRGAAHRHRVP